MWITALGSRFLPSSTAPLPASCPVSAGFPSFLSPLSSSLFWFCHPPHVYLHTHIILNLVPHIIENMWYLFFWVWFISLNMLISRSIHFRTNATIPFFFTAAYTSTVACDTFFSIYSSADRPLSWVYILTVVSRAARMFVIGWLSVIQVVAQLSHLVVLLFTFLRKIYIDVHSGCLS